MTREEAKDLALSILVIVVALLIADCIWLHVKCAGDAERLDELERRLELTINPPSEPTFGDKAKDAYGKAKDATVREYNRVKAAASAGYHAAKDELNK